MNKVAKNKLQKLKEEQLGNTITTTALQPVKEAKVHLSKYLSEWAQRYNAMQLALICASFSNKDKYSMEEWQQLIMKEFTREYRKQ